MKENVDSLLMSNAAAKAPDSPAPAVPRETPAPVELNIQTKEPSGIIQPKEITPELSPAKQEVAPIEQAAKPQNEYGDETESEAPSKADIDNEYGLEQEAPKTYTKSEMDAYANQLIRERLARLERNHPPPTQQQQQQAAQQGFEYDENSNLNWQQQLEQFTWQVMDKREQQRAAQLQQAIEQERMAELEMKFRSGMDKFSDYHKVVSGKNVTDAMVMAASENPYINDPAALFYAASMRMPDELAKIAQIKNPYAQAAAIGRLDAQLRVKPKKTSDAPKPLSPTKADTAAPMAQPKQTTGNPLDDLLVANQRERMALINSRRR